MFPYKPFPKVACRLFSLRPPSRSLPSFLGTGGGGKGPAGGAGRIGSVVVLNVAAFALEGPLALFVSGPLTVVNLGTELVVATRGGRPGWTAAPEERPRLIDPFFVGDRPFSWGEVTAERTSAPPIGISPEVGVGRE